MRLLLLLSAILAALTGTAGGARAAVAVQQTATLSASAARPASAPAEQVRRAQATARIDRAGTPLPYWALVAATPRWIDRLRV